MSPEAQRIAIAKVCGFDITDGEDPRGLCTKKGKVYCGVPNYLNDLNAMHEAEKALNLNSNDKDAHYWKYQLALSNAVNAKDRNKGPLAIIRATAVQRAEAFLRTLNLWKE